MPTPRRELLAHVLRHVGAERDDGAAHAPRQAIADLDEGGRLAGARDRLDGQVRSTSFDDVLRVLKNGELET
jgi:hypothetical protein